MRRPRHAATIARVVACVAYFAALAALAWSTGHPADGGDSEAGLGGWQLVLSLVVLAGWAAWSALVGYLAGPVALVLVVVAVVGPAEVGGDHDSDELTAVNWLLEATFSFVFVAAGVWWRVRRRPATSADSPVSAERHRPS